MKLAPKKNVKLECLLLVSLFRLVYYLPNPVGIFQVFHYAPGLTLKID